MRIVRVAGLVTLMMGAIACAPSSSGAQTASAWTLWEKNYTMKGTTGTTTWEPQDGFEQLNDCRMAGQQILRIALDYMKNNGAKLLGPVQLDGRAATFVTGDSANQNTVNIRYLCFPGSFDPRPRP